MLAEIPRFELDVLRWHRDQSRRLSDENDRRDAQGWLALNGYIARNSEDRFSITPKGIHYLNTRL